MYCQSCGKMLLENSSFCSSCGSKVKDMSYLNSSITHNYNNNSVSYNNSNYSNNAYNFFNQVSGSLSSYDISIILLSAVSIICSLITFNIIYSWVTVIACGIMIYLYANNRAKNPLLYALPFTLFMGKELVYWLIAKAPYIRGFTFILGFSFFLLDLIALICCWIFVSKNDKMSKISYYFVLIMLGINILGIIFTMIKFLNLNIKYIIYYLGMLTFLSSMFISMIEFNNIRNCNNETYTSPTSYNNYVNTYFYQNNNNNY